MVAAGRQLGRKKGERKAFLGEACVTGLSLAENRACGVPASGLLLAQWVAADAGQTGALCGDHADSFPSSSQGHRLWSSTGGSCRADADER